MTLVQGKTRNKEKKYRSNSLLCKIQKNFTDQIVKNQSLSVPT